MSSTTSSSRNTDSITENSSPESKLHVLHVDDNEDFSNLFNMGFKKWFNVTSTTSGHKALELLKHGGFDAIITDYEMPDMDGITLLRAVRKTLPDFPVVFYTGQGNEQVAREAFLSGANDYFIKEYRGFSFKDRLVNSVRRAVERSRTEIALLRERDMAQRYFNLASTFVVIVNTDFSIRIINKCGCELLGYAEEEIRGKDWFEIAIPPEIKNSMKAEFNRALRSEIPPIERYENEIITKSGERKLLAWQNSFLRDEYGKFDGLLGSGIDITELKVNELRIQHLNRILKATRNINQIIVQELSLEPLIHRTCVEMVQTGGYESAFIVLIHRDGTYKAAQSSGIDEECFFRLQNDFLRGNYPRCISTVLENGEMFTVADAQTFCNGSSMAAHYCRESRIVVPLKTAERIHGVLVVCFPPSLKMDDEEKDLLRQLADDVAYAIDNIYVRQEHEKYEKALIESEENYRTIFDSSEDAIYIRDMETGKLLDANRKARNLFGAQPGITRFADNASEVVTYTREDALKVYEEVKSGVTVIREWKVKKDDGSIFWAEVNAVRTVIRGRACVMTTIRDISQRKESENRIRESEESYRTIFNASNDGICVREVGTGTFIDANDKYYEMFGYSPQEAASLPPGASSIGIYPYTVQRALECFNSTSSDKESKPLEWLMQNKSGKIFWVELTKRCAEIRGKKCAIINYKDITERKSAEERIRESEESYRSIFNASQDAIFLIDYQKRKVFDANKKAMELYKYPLEEIVNLKMDDVVTGSPFSQQQKMNLFEKAARGEEVSAELYARDKEGREFKILSILKAVDILGAKWILVFTREIPA